MESTLVFLTLDELIEDLKSGEQGKKIYVVNKLMELRKSFESPLREREMFLSFDRIIQRIEIGDISESITMIRELQDDVATPYSLNYRVKSAWHRYADWRSQSICNR